MPSGPSRSSRRWESRARTWISSRPGPPELNPEDPLLSQGHEACLDWMFEPSGVRIADIRKHPEGAFLADRRETPYEKYRESGFPTPSGKMEFTSLC